MIKIRTKVIITYKKEKTVSTGPKWRIRDAPTNYIKLIQAGILKELTTYTFLQVRLTTPLFSKVLPLLCFHMK